VSLAEWALYNYRVMKPTISLYTLALTTHKSRPNLILIVIHPEYKLLISPTRHHGVPMRRKYQFQKSSLWRWLYVV